MLPEYTFVPWLRRGVAAQISEIDRLGTNPETGPKGRATVPVELELEYVPAGGGSAPARPVVRRDISILGPADVASIMAEAILRSVPADRALAATPGELAYVEFYDEDFPWRYTPAHATTDSRLRPWLALLVLTEDEFEPVRERQGRLPVLTPAETTVLPPRTETWAWAHAQISGTVAAAGGVDGAISAAPDHALARLLSPRRLEPETQYFAFLVPAFEAGRLAGLGRDASVAPVQKPAWGTPAHEADRDLPVYHRFTFQTGRSADFETLVRKLVAAPVGDEFGKRPLDVSDPGFGLTASAGATVELEAALAPPEMNRTEFPGSPGSAVVQELLEILDAGAAARPDGDDDPVVAPPSYARLHAGLALLANAAGDSAWLAELNLDLRSRAAAGLGAEVVRERQEELMQRAWEQVGRVEEANQRLREAELARAAAEAVFRKHVATAGDSDRVLVLTSAAQSGISEPAAAVTTSIRGAVDASAVPAAAQTTAFRRITRPERPLMRRLPGETRVIDFQGGLLDAMNAPPTSALSTAPPPLPPVAGVELQTVTTAVNDSMNELQGQADRPDLVFMELAHTFLRQRRQANPNENISTLAFRTTLKTTLDQRVTTRLPGQDAASLDAAQRVRALITAIGAVASDGPDGVAVTVNAAAFELEYGDKVAGKSFDAVTIRSSTPPAGSKVAGMTSLSAVADFRDALQAFAAVDGRQDPAPPLPLAGGNAPAALAGHMLQRLEPAGALGEQIARAVPAIAGRNPTDPDRLAPVMAHPKFRDPMFESLRALSQDFIIPNVSDLPRNTITLMEPNPRFIESYLAGLNHAFAQELLWREYPTDQRGTCFKVFWDTKDALDHADREDIGDLPEWAGQLGANSASPASVLVLVVRGELLERYPRTVIFAQEATWPTGAPTSAPRILDPAGEIRHPIFHARLEPDITIVGFQLSETQARGDRATADAGWFFALMERPGEPRFGLDDQDPPPPLASWNDLAWTTLAYPAGSSYVEIDANAGRLVPTTAQTAQWGATSADMASILFQSPILYARHASEMLP